MAKGDVTNEATEQPRSKHATRQPRAFRREKGLGTTYRVEKVLPSGKIVQYYRSARSYTVDGKTYRKVAQAKTPAESLEKLNKAITQHQIELGLKDLEAFEVQKKYEALTVGQCVDDWFKEKLEEQLARETYRMYESRMRQHILPVFGTVPVRSVTNEQVKTFMRETLPNKGLGADSIRQTFIILKSSFEAYVRDHKLAANPATGIRMPSKRSRTQAERDELQEASQYIHKYLLEEARKIDNEARWVLALLGLRQSEALGLTWDDLRMSSDPTFIYKVVINKQLQRITAQHGCGAMNIATSSYPCGQQSDKCPQQATETSWVLKTTKTTSGTRELAVPKEVWEILVKHKKKQMARAKQADFKPYVPADPEEAKKFARLMFTRPGGLPVAAQSDRRELEKMREKIAAQYTSLTVHSLRHIATTTMIEQGVDREQLVNIMGWSHKNADVQIATYAHNDRARAAQDAVANASVPLFAGNLLWVGLGNLVGGGLIVGAGYWVLGGRPQVGGSAERRSTSTEIAA